jgi:hypothetical protein
MRVILPISLLSVLALTPACGSGSSGDAESRGAAGTTGTTGTAGTGTDSPGAASYRVPVSAELEPWARYPVEEVEFEREGSRVRISYPFPEWLSGDGADIELEGEYEDGADTFAVTAEQGSGTCTRANTRFECTEHLPGLEIDREKARDSMQDAGLASDEITQRLRVTSVFESDPIGIFEFDLAR